MTTYRRNYPIKDKLLERSNYVDGCWLWNAAKDACGYGRIWYNNKNRTAHTVAFEVFQKPIPAGLHVLHVCDTPACVNPAHLMLGSHRDNMKHKSERGRVSGERNPNHHMKKVKRTEKA